MLPLVYRLVATTRVPEKKQGRGKKKEEPVKVVKAAAAPRDVEGSTDLLYFVRVRML